MPGSLAYRASSSSRSASGDDRMPEDPTRKVPIRKKDKLRSARVKEMMEDEGAPSEDFNETLEHPPESKALNIALHESQDFPQAKRSPRNLSALNSKRGSRLNTEEDDKKNVLMQL